MYTQDWHDLYPPGGRTCLDPTRRDGDPGCRDGALDRKGRRIGYTETWQGGGLLPLLPYVKAQRVLWCPAQPADFPLPTDPKSYYNGFEWLRTPARIEYPESKVLILEAYSFHDVKPAVRFNDPPNPQRYFGVAFVDGHVKSMRLSQGCSGSGHPNCVGWESCQGPGGNGNYLCSGYGRGAKARDFP